jgi:hypothetical protein
VAKLVDIGRFPRNREFERRWFRVHPF